MSSGKIEKFFNDVLKSRYNNSVDHYFSLSNCVVSFSSLPKNKQTSWIYFGNEKIPFKERHPEFKVLLRNEFADALKKFGNSIGKKK
ncbi:MAG: hypothetical protein ACFFA6_06860 [Promethearchaeota archaeon]